MAKMTDARFHALLDGPLAHPLPLFRISRLALALRSVVEDTGDAGAAALERIAAAYAARDAGDGEDLEDLEASDSTGDDLLDALADRTFQRP